MDMLYDTNLKPYYQFTKTRYRIRSGVVITALILKLRADQRFGALQRFGGVKNVWFYLDQIYFTTLLQPIRGHIRFLLVLQYLNQKHD